MASNLESKSVMLKKNVGKCTHYLAETKVNNGSGESGKDDRISQLSYWILEKVKTKIQNNLLPLKWAIRL